MCCERARRRHPLQMCAPRLSSGASLGQAEYARDHSIALEQRALGCSKCHAEVLRSICAIRRSTVDPSECLKVTQARVASRRSSAPRLGGRVAAKTPLADDPSKI